MKTRISLVSNSSTSSFCIYGWIQRDLKNTPFEESDYEIWPTFAKLRNEIVKIDPLIELISFHNRDRTYYIVGIGRSDTDIHDENVINHGFCEPRISEAKKLDKIAKRLKLPEPQVYKDTWYDG